MVNINQTTPIIILNIKGLNVPIKREFVRAYKKKQDLTICVYKKPTKHTHQLRIDGENIPY